jgi:hypothetical protein
MSTARYLRGDFILRATLVGAISFGLGSAAMAAESEASSMAGGMPQSGATVSATSQAQESGSTQSSQSGSSLSTTDRSTAASAYDSSLTGSGPAVAVKNIATDSATLKNPMAPARGVQATSNQNGLIQNSVKQKDSDFVTNSTPTNSQLNGAKAAAVPARVPHAKVQYWNQGKNHRRGQR